MSCHPHVTTWAVSVVTKRVFLGASERWQHRAGPASPFSILLRSGLVCALVLGVLPVGLYTISAEAVDRPFQVGDVFLGVANGQVQWRDALGHLIQTLDTGTNSFATGMAFDTAGRLYVTNFSV